MTVRPIGRLHFIVSSRSSSREYLVDLDRQGEHPYFCGCIRFEKHPRFHSQPCHHIQAAVEYMKKAVPLKRRP